MKLRNIDIYVYWAFAFYWGFQISSIFGLIVLATVLIVSYINKKFSDPAEESTLDDTVISRDTDTSL